MSELDILNLARSCGQNISAYFAQVIAITFAMVVAIYYFLHQAGIRMKIFAFIIYTFGMFTYLGLMLIESGVATGTTKALHAIPVESRSPATQYYLALRESWVGLTSSILLNLVYWVLWFGTGYLLFFWKKPAEVTPIHH